MVFQRSESEENYTNEKMCSLNVTLPSTMHIIFLRCLD